MRRVSFIMGMLYTLRLLKQGRSIREVEEYVMELLSEFLEDYVENVGVYPYDSKVYRQAVVQVSQARG